MPKWEISDPFGRGAIRKARYEYLRKAAQCEAYRAQLEDVFCEQRNAVTLLASELAHEQDVTAEQARRLKVSEDARKSLGDKLRIANATIDELTHRLAELSAKYDKLESEHEELTAAHEKVIRGLTDKEETVE